MAEPEMEGKEPVEPKVDRDGKKTNDHRQVSLVDRVESRREHFHPRVTGEPERVKTQRPGGLRRRIGGKAPMLINQPDDRLRQNDQPDRGRNRKQHDQPHGMGERSAKFMRVAERCAPRDERQRHGCDRHAKNAERQLHQAKRNVEPADRSVAKSRSEAAVDEHVYLHGAGCDDGRAHQNQNRAHTRVAPFEVGIESEADATQRRKLGGQLPQATDERADRQADQGTLTELRIEPPTKCDASDD